MQNAGRYFCKWNRFIPFFNKQTKKQTQTKLKQTQTWTERIYERKYFIAKIEFILNDHWSKCKCKLLNKIRRNSSNKRKYTNTHYIHKHLLSLPPHSETTTNNNKKTTNCRAFLLCFHDQHTNYTYTKIRMIFKKKKQKMINDKKPKTNTLSSPLAKHF